MIDYEYACKIYYDYCEQYNENNGSEELDLEYENESVAEDYSSEVEGRWGGSEHIGMADWAAYGEMSENETEILKWGAQYPDIVNGMSRTTVNVEWQGL